MRITVMHNRKFWGVLIAMLIIVLFLIGAIIFVVIYLTEKNECDNRVMDDKGIPEVMTSLGKIKGRVVASPQGGGLEVEQFMGIPFALPPVGQRRFANPKPYGKFPGGVLEAFEPSAGCLQSPVPGHKTEASTNEDATSEDCLYLNVWRPRPVKQGRAVMVWIHGGAFTFGSAMVPSYNGSEVASYGDIIFVGMNYRLGVFGFFHTGDARMSNGNFGLLDQQLAIRWVHDHIAAFGGDPDRVTIYGESAGGVSVAHQLLLPGNQGLFSRAIMQSGDSTTDWAWNSLDAKVAAATKILADNSNCTNDATLLDCLRDLDGKVLQSLTLGMISNVIAIPKVDGVTIRDNPEVLLEAGEFVNVDVLLGYTQNEASMFINQMPGVELLDTDPWQAYVTLCQAMTYGKGQTKEEVEEIMKVYMPKENTTEAVRSVIVDMYGDQQFVCPGEFSAKRFNDNGMKVYEYLLTLRSSMADIRYPEWWGVPHGDDVQWVFGWSWFLSVPGKQWTKEEKQFSLEVMGKWTQFAKYGSPSSDGLWSPWTGDGPAYLELAGPGDFTMFRNTSARPDKCHLWRY